MTLVLLLGAVTVLLGILYVCKGGSRPRKLPDGVIEAPLEKGWPIIGILPDIIKPLHQYLMKLGKKHGNLFRIRFGMRDIFVLNNHNIVKMCFKDDGDNFSGRWDGAMMKVIVQNSGVMMIDSEKWEIHRSFILKVFRDMGRSRMIEDVSEECQYMLAEIDDLVGKRVDFSNLLPIYICNIISKFLMRKRHNREHDDIRQISLVSKNMLKQEDNLLNFLFMFPFWDKSELLSNLGFYFSLRKKELDKSYDIFRKEIHKHMENLDLQSEGEDLMDKFLIEQAKKKSSTGSEGSFTEFQLISTSMELFIAATETTSTTIEWSLLFLSRYPEMQRKMHEEIISLIGLKCLPSLNDKKSLPYTQAILDEVQRLSTVVPLSIMHRNFRDTVINGIFIPAGSLIFPNIYACHRDPQVWERPLEFHPEHFLNIDSEGLMKYTPREELITFGMGKRQCLGESLARSFFFIFVTSIIQRYRVKFANNISEEDYQETLVANDGFIRFSKIKDFVFERWE